MKVVYECCCGIDVHKSMLVVCLRKGRQTEVRKIGTTTEELQELSEWLKRASCEMVAMESTGSYWKPLYNVFELEGLSAIVVNAAHMRVIPGRKTDESDAEWISDLLRHGLLKASFIPGREQREVRELTRFRKSRMEERARDINRLQKMLEGANIKLSGALSDITGKSAMSLLEYAVNTKRLDIAEISKRRHTNMRASAEELYEALKGVMSPLQRELFKEVMRVIKEETKQIERTERLIAKYLPEAYKAAISAIDELPGIGRVSAEQIVAEVGCDMSRFPSASHLCSWAGVCPGNNESAGKRKSGRTNKANKTLKSTLVQCAKAAVRDKESFFSAQYQKLAVRRGHNRATVAVAHSMLISIWHVLRGEPFADLGIDYYVQFNRERKIRSHLQQLARLGYNIFVNTMDTQCPNTA
jgi:transposase